MNVVDFTKIYKLSLFFNKIRETICETLLWEIAAWLMRIRGSYLPHPLLMQDKYIVAIKLGFCIKLFPSIEIKIGIFWHKPY